MGLWLIVQALDDLLVIGTFGDERRLTSAVSSRAGSALVASDLRRRPDYFDHRQAWDRQRDALCELVGDVCLAPHTGEPDAVVRSQQLSLRRLARALAAIWAIDGRIRSPRVQEPPMPLRSARMRVVASQRYDARLARRILEGGTDASRAAMTLLEYGDPSTLDAAVAMIADHGTVTAADAFDCVTDAWETYRHLEIPRLGLAR